MASIRKYSASLEGKSKERYQQKLALIDGVDPYTISKKDWSEKVDDYPSISYPDIVNYLIFTPSAYTSDDLKSYKSLQAYNNFIEGWVKDMKAFKAKDNIVVVAARVSTFHGLILCSTN